MLIRTRLRESLKDPVLRLGLPLSVGVGVLFYFDTDAKAALAVFAALLCTVISLQLQLLVDAARRHDVDTRQARLVNRIEAISWLPDVLDKMLNAATRVEQQWGSTPAAQASRKAFESTLHQLRDLERGHLIADYDDTWLVNSLTEHAGSSLRATSVQDVDLTWWQSPAGRHYWHLHKDAIARGVRVERIFIYREWSEDLDALAREQQAGGVLVRRVDTQTLPRNLRIDMIIWDDVCGYESHVNAAGEGIENFYTVVPDDLQSMTERYDVISSCAEVLQEAVA